MDIEKWHKDNKQPIAHCRCGCIVGGEECVSRFERNGGHCDTCTVIGLRTMMYVQWFLIAFLIAWNIYF